MSPMSGGSPGTSAVGNDRTLVAASMPRQSRLSKRIAESSVSTITSSALGVDSTAAASVMARRRVDLRSVCCFQSADTARMSIFGAFADATFGTILGVLPSDLPDACLDTSLDTSLEALLGKFLGAVR